MSKSPGYIAGKKGYVIALWAVLLLSPLFSFSQWSVGFKGGFNLAFNNLAFEEDNENIDHRTSLLGLYLAVPVEYLSERMFSLRTGLAFSQKGTRFNYLEVGPGRFFDTKYIMDYLELPIIVKAAFRLKPFQLYGLGGVQTGYAINMRVVRISTHPDIAIRESFPIEFQDAGISRFDLGLLIGGGIETKIAKDRRIFVEMQYNFGVKDINKAANKDAFNEGRTFSMGILIPINKKKTYRLAPKE